MADKFNLNEKSGTRNLLALAEDALVIRVQQHCVESLAAMENFITDRRYRGWDC